MRPSQPMVVMMVVIMIVDDDNDYTDNKDKQKTDLNDMIVDPDASVTAIGDGGGDDGEGGGGDNDRRWW